MAFTVVVSDGLGDSLGEAARLFVDVDAAYGDTPWWTPVRLGGLAAAERLLSQPKLAVSCARSGTRLVGLAALTQPNSDGEVELVRVMTHPAATGQGVASACVASLLGVADASGLTVWLDVLADAQGAIRLYERFGFVAVSSNPGGHSGRPAIQMRRLLPQAPP